MGKGLALIKSVAAQAEHVHGDVPLPGDVLGMEQAGILLFLLTKYGKHLGIRRSCPVIPDFIPVVSEQVQALQSASEAYFGRCLKVQSSF